MLKDLLSSLAGSLYGYIGCLLVGAALGGAGVFYVQGLRLEAAITRAEAAEDKLDTTEQRLVLANDETAICVAASQEQNAALEAMKKRAEEAEAAMAQADSARQTAEQRAIDILRERTPAGADKCEAARNAFSEELRKERGQ